MEQVKDLLTWFRINPGKTISLVLALLAAGAGGGTWLAHAEDSHRQVPEIVRVVDGLTKIHEAEQVAERVKAEEEAKRKAELARLCQAGTLKDPVLCASVGAPLR